MEPNRDEYGEKLNRLFEISLLQRRLIREKRIEELLSCQAERDALFPTLSRPANCSDPALRELADKITESDRRLMDETRAVMEGMSSKLNHLKAGQSALRAYGAPSEKRTIG